MSQHKLDVAKAAAITAWSAATGTMTALEVLQAGQIIVATAISLLGGAYLIWKWRKDIRGAREQNRRRSDKPK